MPDDPTSIRARQHFDELWSAAAPFISTDQRSSARAQFHQVFWEVYLAAALLELGKHLVPRERGPSIAGPDFVQRNPDVYYEAIAVQSGTGTDAVVEAAPLVAREVPDEQISLRLMSGLSEKVKKYTRYTDSNVVRPEVPFVIAINAGAVPSGQRESTLPRIVRTVFPFGYEVLHFDPTTQRCVARSFTSTSRPALVKQSGATIPTSFFDDKDSAGISAILYSCVDPFNWPSRPGRDFVIVHNPNSRNPLQRGLLANTWEFWIDRDDLRGEMVAAGTD